MDKPNTIESVVPCSGEYSWKKDFRLNAWLLIATAIYCIARLLTKHHPDWSAGARALLALAPVIPGLLYLRSWLRFIRGMDELQQRIQLCAVLYATVGTLVVATIIDTLNASGTTFGLAPHGLGPGGAFMVMLVLWLVCGKIVSHRYR